MKIRIPFNLPHMTGGEIVNIAKAHDNGSLAGDGPFTILCHSWLESFAKVRRALLTHSCTGALEMAALLLDIRPGDEVILPSYTFVSTANAFVLRGATPVFIDIRPDTLNIDEDLIESAITSKTKAIIPVHYAGVACEMDSIMEIAGANRLAVVEDAAQAIMSTYKGRPLGGIGNIGAYSFHETKNVISGEGGALLINDDRFSLLAEIIREKGTDRSQFFRGEVDKYTWKEIGSSYLPGEVVAAFLWAQLECAENITKNRREIWNNYQHLLADIELTGAIRRPLVPESCQHNAHMYYILLEEGRDRQKVLSFLKARGIGAVSHYVPLHSSPAGLKFGRTSGSMNVVEKVANQIIRLPLWVGLTMEQQVEVVTELKEAIFE